MVKLINDIPDSSVVKRIICKNCGGTLEYVPNDIKQDWDYDWTGKYSYDYITCVGCTTRVRI